MSGQQLWVSPSLEGLSPGTPVISADGAYVFLTYNSVGATIGHFTILDGATGEIFFSQTYDDAPFAPLGIFHNPAEGYYDGGKNNRNDILVWSVQPKPSATSVAPGATFAFQFPIGFAAGGVTNLAYTKLGNDAKEFQTIQRPVFADLGRSLYWGTTRSQFWCWVGEQGLDRYRFNRARTSLVGFTRGTPAMQAVFAPPALSNDPINRFVFGGTAAPEFVKMSSNLTDNIAVLTGELVKSMAHVSPDDTYVYYLETDGTLHQASTRDLSDNWILSLGGTTEGEFELNKDGTILYVADASGSLQAFRVGDVPTEAPSSVPSSLPSSTPSFSPTETTTAPRTASPMAITSAPVMAPVAKPTATETTTTVRTNSPTIDGNATPIVDSSSASHLQGSYFFFVLVIVPLQWI